MTNQTRLILKLSNSIERKTKLSQYLFDILLTVRNCAAEKKRSQIRQNVVKGHTQSSLSELRSVRISLPWYSATGASKHQPGGV